MPNQQHWDPVTQRWVDDTTQQSSVAVVDTPVEEVPRPVSRDVLANPPQGWNVRPIPHLNTLTIEYECSSVAGEVFRTTDRDAIAQHIQDIEDAKLKQPEQAGQITQGHVDSFGAAFGVR